MDNSLKERGKITGLLDRLVIFINKDAEDKSPIRYVCQINYFIFIIVLVVYQAFPVYLGPRYLFDSTLLPNIFYIGKLEKYIHITYYLFGLFFWRYLYCALLTRLVLIGHEKPKNTIDFAVIFRICMLCSFSIYLVLLPYVDIWLSFIFEAVLIVKSLIFKQQFGRLKIVSAILFCHAFFTALFVWLFTISFIRNWVDGLTITIILPFFSMVMPEIK